MGAGVGTTGAVGAAGGGGRGGGRGGGGAGADTMGAGVGTTGAVGAAVAAGGAAAGPGGDAVDEWPALATHPPNRAAPGREHPTRSFPFIDHLPFVSARVVPASPPDPGS